MSTKVHEVRALVRRRDGWRPCDLEDLRDVIARSILDDPEDVWVRQVSQRGMLHAVEAEATFADPVDVIIELGGQGE